MAQVNLSPLFNGQTIFGLTGLPLVSGQIFTYQAGSSTPLTTYTDVNGNIANTNPIILGTDGKLPSELWLQSGYSYKFIVEDVNDNVLNTYDNIAGILTQIPTSTATVPTGCILIWSGSVGSIPSGFLLCDGTNGTPDLRNSFVLGAGNAYAIGQTGGSTDAIVVNHTHTGSLSSYTHNHYVATSDSSNYPNPGTYMGNYNPQNYDNFKPNLSGSSTAPDILPSSDNTHSHTLSINPVGTSGTNANMPPYYALAYIMKS